jgi:hypothetical protein
MTLAEALRELIASDDALGIRTRPTRWPAGERAFDRKTVALNNARAALSAHDAQPAAEPLTDEKGRPMTYWGEFEAQPAAKPELERLKSVVANLANALGVIKYKSISLADAQVVALEALSGAQPSQPKEPTRSQKLDAAGFTRRPSLWAMEARQALELIATPMRPDGTWNRDRATCRQIAAEALGRYDEEKL